MKNIKKLASFKGWTLKKLSEKMGVSQATITNWNKGNCWPHPDNVTFLCELLECEPKDLID